MNDVPDLRRITPDSARTLTVAGLLKLLAGCGPATTVWFDPLDGGMCVLPVMGVHRTWGGADSQGDDELEPIVVFEAISANQPPLETQT